MALTLWLRFLLTSLNQNRTRPPSTQVEQRLPEDRIVELSSGKLGDERAMQRDA